MLIILALSFLTSFILGGKDVVKLPLVNAATPSLLFMYIAILSGIGATFSWARPNLSANLPGIAVTVALIPPLCITGIGLSALSREIIVSSFQLFMVNLVGIAASSAIVFSLLGYHQMRYAEDIEIKNEEIQKETGQDDSQDVAPVASQVPQSAS